MLDAINDGRTDLVFEYLAKEKSPDLGALVETCAYYGDVSALRHLEANGASIPLDLIGPAFHGHWQLTQFLIERGANANLADRATGETALHSALSQQERARHNQVVKVLLAAGAKPNKKTKKNKPTGAFMRDCRTKGETPLHRAAAFGDEEAVQLLLDAGGDREVLDMNGETPLAWASWYGRPTAILRKLLYGKHRINPAHGGMENYLIGKPTLRTPGQ
jgi:uncharacterized protein